MEQSINKIASNTKDFLKLSNGQNIIVLVKHKQNISFVVVYPYVSFVQSNRGAAIRLHLCSSVWHPPMANERMLLRNIYCLLF